MDRESTPLIQPAESDHRRIRQHWVSTTLLSSWIILVVVGFLFLQQIVNGTLSAANLNGSLLVGLNQNFQRVTNYSGCDGMWSCTFEICNIYMEPAALYVAMRLPGTCPNNVTIGSTWDVYADWIIFRLSWIGLFVALGLQAMTILARGLQLFTHQAWAKWLTLSVSILTLMTIEVSYILWIAFLHHFRQLAGDRPPQYLEAWTLGANIFLMVTTPLFYEVSLT